MGVIPIHYSELWIHLFYLLTQLACFSRNAVPAQFFLKLDELLNIFYSYCSYSGSVGERMNLRYFLTIGMITSGFFGFLFGLAFWTHIHSLSYFLFVQIAAGFFQSTGWPGCVAVVGNWFGKSKRGTTTSQ